jgi:hypothetical protein
VGGTSPLAIHYFVEVVRIGDIGRMHYGLDLLTSSLVELSVIVTTELLTPTIRIQELQ